MTKLEKITRDAIRDSGVEGMQFWPDIVAEAVVRACANIAHDMAVAWHNTPNTRNGIEEEVCYDIKTAILALFYDDEAPR